MSRRVYEVYLRWWRGPVQLVGEGFVLDVARAEAYELSAHMAAYTRAPGAEVAFDLAAVHDARSALAFVQQWGLLAGTTDGPAAGQPVLDVLHSASLVREALRLIMRQRQLRPARDPERDQALARLAAKAGADRPDAFAVQFADAGLEDARYENLFDESGSVLDVLGLRAQSLLAAVYLQVRALLLNDQPVGQCPNCGRFFSHDDPRQRYCGRTCLVTAASRRHRQRKRGGGVEPTADAEPAAVSG